MKTLLLLVFVGSVLGLQSPMEGITMEQQETRETKNMDPGLIHSMARVIQSAISQKLTSYKEEFDARFDQLETLCRESNVIQTDVSVISDEEDSKITKLVDKFVDQLLRFSESSVDRIRESMMETLNGTMANLDVKLLPVYEDIANLKGQISKLVTQDEIADLQQKLTSLGTETSAQIKEEMTSVATKDDLQSSSDQMEAQLGVITSSVANFSRCSNQEKIQEVLEKLSESGKELDELSTYLKEAGDDFQCESTFENISEYLQTLRETTMENSLSLSGLEDLIKSMQTDFGAQMQELESVAQQITKISTTPPPPPILTTTQPTTTTTTEMPPAPCLDSKFVGAGRSLDVCRAAVRFQKCHLQFVAFHCCKSCMDAGLITSPPHYIGSRIVSVLQALKSIRP